MQTRLTCLSYTANVPLSESMLADLQTNERYPTSPARVGRLLLSCAALLPGCIDLKLPSISVGISDSVDAARFEGLVVHDGGAVTLADGGVPDDWGEYFGFDPWLPTDLVGQGLGQACDDEDRSCRPGLACEEGMCVVAGDQPEGAWCVLSAECHVGQCVQSRCAAAGTGTTGTECVSSADCEAGMRCGTTGTQLVCQADGAGDVGEQCRHLNECGAGLSCVGDGDENHCSPTGITDVTPGLWSGVICDAPDGGAVRAYFEVPGASEALTGDYFRLPFPNAVATNAAGAVDLTGFPTPGVNPLVGIDPVAPYVNAAQGTVGFSASSTVHFRFSGGVDFNSFSVPGALEWVDITDPTAPVHSGMGYRFSPSRSNYTCHNTLSIRRPDTDPMRPGHTYAVWFSDAARSASGEGIARSENLTALLSDVPPTDPVLGGAYPKYAPFRTYLAEQGLAPETVVNATVFTVSDPTQTMRALAQRVAEAPVPQATAWTKCIRGGTSPCPQAEGARACSSDVGFDEYHLLLTLPVFQTGVPPYAETGGRVQTSGPVRSEQVCASLTLPRDTPVASELPLVIFAHGTGGSFRSHVHNGLAAALANPASGADVVFATLGFDQVQHGPRRGDSEQEPEHLFFNFLNPDASQGNPLQGAADILSVLRFAGALNGLNAPVRVDDDSVFVFAHSQGSMAASLALPLASGVKAAVLSGNGASLLHGLLTKTQPVDVAGLVPLLINDGVAYDAERGKLSGKLPGGIHHPVLTLIQHHLDPADPVSFARLLTDPQAAHPTHVFQTFGLHDHFSPPETLHIFAGVAGLAVARAHESATPAYELGHEWDSFPLSSNLAVGDAFYTAAVRQYGPMAGEDGHFVAFSVPDAADDIRHFLNSAALGLTPTVGR